MSANATGGDSKSCPYSVGPVGTCTTLVESNEWPSYYGVVDLPFKNWPRTEDNIETILYQLQADLINVVRMALPPECPICHSSLYIASAASNMDFAIKKCVTKALARWAPEFEKTSSSEAAEGFPPLVADFSNEPPTETTINPPSIPSEVTNANSEKIDWESYTKPLVDSRPHELCDPIDATSSKPPSILPKASLPRTEREGISYEPRLSNRGLPWNKYKEILHRLYMEQDKPLPEVRKRMEQEYRFSATLKQYRYQLGEKWRWKKYNQSLTTQRHGHAEVKATDQQGVNHCTPLSLPEDCGSHTITHDSSSAFLPGDWGSRNEPDPPLPDPVLEEFLGVDLLD